MARAAPQLVDRPGGAAAPAGPDYKELWFSLMRFRWRSLGVMPASAGTSVLPVAKGLAEIGGRFRPRSVALIPAEQLDLESVAQIVEQLMRSTGSPGATRSRAPPRCRPSSPSRRSSSTRW